MCNQCQCSGQPIIQKHVTCDQRGALDGSFEPNLLNPFLTVNGLVAGDGVSIVPSPGTGKAVISVTPPAVTTLFNLQIGGNTPIPIASGDTLKLVPDESLEITATI